MKTTLKSTTSRLALTLGMLALATMWSPDAMAANSKSESYFSEAQELIADGNFNAAIIELKNAIKADTGNAKARLQLGLIYLQNGDAAAAEKELSASLRAGGDRKLAILPLGRALIQLGEATRVLSEIQPASEDESIRAQLHVIRANAHMILNEIDLATQEVDTALSLNDKIPDPHIGKAVLAQRQNDLAGAQAAIETALSLDENNFEVLYRLGDILRVQSKHDEALEYLDRAMEISPNIVQVRVARSMSNLGAGNDDAAEEDAQAVLERDPDNAIAKYVQAVVLSRRGEAQPALDLLSSAPVLESFPPAVYLLSNLFYVTQQYESARTYIDKYNEQIKDDTNGQFLKALVLLAQNESAPAIETLEKLVVQFPNNYRIAAVLASAYLNVGEFEKASKYFDIASTLNPEDDDLKLRLAQSQLVGGAPDNAAGILEQIVQDDPASEGAVALLIVSYTRSGDFDKAQQEIERLKSALPDSALPYNFEAAIALAQQNMDAARAALQNALKKQPDFHTARINLARIARSENNSKEAEQQYQEVLKLDSKQVDALIGLAEMAHEAGDTQKAIGYVDSAISGNPDNARPGAYKAQLLLQSDQLEKANDLIISLRGRFPEDTLVLETQSVILEEKQDLLGAISSLETLSRLNTSQDKYQTQIGRIHRRLKNYREAANAFDRAININPSSATARAGRLVTEIDLNGPDRAKELALSMRQQLGAENPLGDILVGDILFRSGNLEESVDYYMAAYDKGPTQNLVLQLYTVLARLGNFDQAKELLQAYLADNKDDSRVRAALADYFIQSGDYDRAIEESEAVLTAEPENAAVLNNLAWLYGEKDQAKKALDLAERAYAIEQNPAIADTLGWLLFQKGDTDRSLELLKMAAEGMADNGEVTYHYAAALNRAGKKDDARAVLKTLLDKGTQFNGLDEARALHKSLSE